MMIKCLNRRYEFIVVALSLALAVLVYVGVYGITKTQFELLGVAAVPRVIAIVLFLLALIKTAQVFVEIKNTPNTEKNPSEGFYKSLIMLFLIIGFVLLIAVLKVSFWLAVFLFLMGSILYQKRPTAPLEWLKLGIFSLLFSFGVHYLFTEVFYFGL